MGILSSASGYSVWRGYDYYEGKRVLSMKKLPSGEIEGIVQGTNEYHVLINIEHSRKSSCDCPRAFGKRIICKHMVALFFAAFPHEAKALLKASEKYEREEEARRQDSIKEIINEVNHLSKSELKQRLIEALIALQSYNFNERY